MASTYVQFVERVYDAAIDPSLWPSVLSDLADMMGGGVAIMRWTNAMTGLGAATNARLEPGAGVVYFRDFVDRNPLRTPPEVMRLRLANWKPHLDVGEAWMPREELIRTPFYNEYSRRFDLNWDLSIGLDAEGMNTGVINIFRDERQGSHTTANLELAAAAQPHLIRAFRLARKVAARGAVSDGLADAADASPNALFLVDGAGKILRLNPRAERLARQHDGLTVIGGRLTAVRHDAARRLEALIGAAAAMEPERRTGGAMALTTAERLRPLSLMTSPVRADRFALFCPGPAVVVCVADLDAGRRLPVQAMRELFHLTHAENLVAAALFEGLESRLAAERLGLSFYTVRSHLALTCESAPGQGSVFCLSLPLAPAATPATVEPDAPLEASQAQVLVVNDNLTNQRVLSLLLEGAGVGVIVAGDGQEALDRWRAGSFDAILMDIQMPVMDGLKATVTIRREEASSGQARTPILVVSANALPEHHEASHAAGADGHLSKPVNAAKLFAALAALDGGEDAVAA